MKKLLMLLLVMSLVIVGCGSSDDNKDDVDKDKEVTTQADKEDDKETETTKVVEATTEVAEVTTEAVQETTTTPETDEVAFNGNILEELSKYVSYDASLTGQELIDSVKHEDIDFLIEDIPIIIEMSGKAIQMGQEMEYSMYSVMKGGTAYIEYNMMGMEQIMLTIEGDEADTTYTYAKGDTVGTYTVEEHEEYMDDESEESRFGSIYDVYDPEFATLYDAHIEMYDGKEVIYIEYGESEDYIVKLWYYPIWNIALSEEVYQGDTLEQVTTFTRFEVGVDIDESLLEVPSNIEFTEGMGMGF